MVIYCQSKRKVSGPFCQSVWSIPSCKHIILSQRTLKKNKPIFSSDIISQVIRSGRPRDFNLLFDNIDDILIYLFFRYLFLYYDL